MTDWIDTSEAAPMLNIPASNLSGLHKHLPATRVVESYDGHGNGRMRQYDRAEVEALRTARLESGKQSHRLTDLPLSASAAHILATVEILGGDLTGDNVTAVVAENAINVSRNLVTIALHDLAVAGFTDRTMRGKRVKHLRITATGKEWLEVNRSSDSYDASVWRTPAAEPEAEPAMLPERVPLEDFPRATTEPPPPPQVAPNEFASVEPGAIAGALLRQVVRQLNDTETAVLVAERDALRAHNESLVTRLDHTTHERDRAEAENRELRGVLHTIETSLAPMLHGRDARFDWLDAATRTDLLRLIGEAAAWAS